MARTVRILTSNVTRRTARLTEQAAASPLESSTRWSSVSAREVPNVQLGVGAVRADQRWWAAGAASRDAYSVSCESSVARTNISTSRVGSNRIWLW